MYKLFISILIGLFFLASCDKPAKTAVPAADTTSATTAQKPRVITFVTMNSPNTYFVNDDNEYAGLEYDFAKLSRAYAGGVLIIVLQSWCLLALQWASRLSS